ncbi:interleukin-1 family member A isoform X1 [Phycodurus eques]|uniref:interleukin-1 family member A isoform X1 n=1 Tax=Phycodurus eques TaxID=693459 RepID=UPI002ACDF2A8|nr:interleukin-1 family member A isoform X1 [Phycodurus eques]
MDVADSLVNGSVLIVHQLHEGKHQYEVENVVKPRHSSGGKQIIRRGDKLVQINGTDLQDLRPEEVAQAIAEGQPMLTVHKSRSKKDYNEQSCSMQDCLQPVSKEVTVLQFSMEMVREENLQQSGSDLGGDAEENGGAEDDICPAEDETNKLESDLLVVTMTETSFSVLRGRGCDAESACGGCHGTGCTLNDIVMVAKTSTVTLVSRGGGTFKQIKMLNTPVEHVASHKYLRGLCSQKTLYVSPQPEKMTIYYYKSTCLDHHYPVVLNFTDSDCFLKCSKKAEQVLLQVEAVDKKKLKSISMNDETTLSFVFYMKTDSTKQRKFESALYRGWYIQIATSASTDSVEMAKSDGRQGIQSFLFVIQT